jgi:hypothetical protein
MEFNSATQAQEPRIQTETQHRCPLGHWLLQDDSRYLLGSLVAPGCERVTRRPQGAAPMLKLGVAVASELTDGRARWQATLGARPVALACRTQYGGRAQRLAGTMRAAHAMAWQARRGARHNAYSVNPKGAQAKPQRSTQGTQRSVVNGAICNRMPRYVKAGAQRPIYPAATVPFM